MELPRSLLLMWRLCDSNPFLEEGSRQPEEVSLLHQEIYMGGVGEGVGIGFGVLLLTKEMLQLLLKVMMR